MSWQVRSCAPGSREERGADGQQPPEPVPRPPHHIPLQDKRQKEEDVDTAQPPVTELDASRLRLGDHAVVSLTLTRASLGEVASLVERLQKLVLLLVTFKQPRLELLRLHGHRVGGVQATVQRRLTGGTVTKCHIECVEWLVVRIANGDVNDPLEWPPLATCPHKLTLTWYGQLPFQDNSIWYQVYESVSTGIQKCYDYIVICNLS